MSSPSSSSATPKAPSGARRLFGLSDVHLGHKVNREAFAKLSPRPGDWLILAGDLGETLDHLRFALDVACERFERVVWVPGNHELWRTSPEDKLTGVARYMAYVEACRARSVLTPEDPFEVFEGQGGPCLVAPLFVLYDYTFRPEGVSEERALATALENDIWCTDEEVLDPSPYPSKKAWCDARVAYSEARLEEAQQHKLPLVIVNHFPLRYDLVRIPRVPLFTPWCGTRRTEQWHVRYGAKVVVSGHLHVRATDFRDGVRFEEVSLGYPRQWNTTNDVDTYVREILPGPEAPASGYGGPIWRNYG